MTPSDHFPRQVAAYDENEYTLHESTFRRHIAPRHGIAAQHVDKLDDVLTSPDLVAPNENHPDRKKVYKNILSAPNKYLCVVVDEKTGDVVTMWVTGSPDPQASSVS